MNVKDQMYHYKCTGCGKELNSKSCYPHGWICVNCRKTTKLTLKCSDCGKDFQVFWDTYRMKDPEVPWRCRECNDKYRNQLYDNKSDEEKKAFVESQKARIKSYWENMSAEDKKKDSDRRKTLWADRKENGTAEAILKAMKDGRKAWWDSLSEEDRKKQWNYMNEGRNEWWDKLTDDEKLKHMESVHEGFKKWFKGLDDKDKKAFLDNLHNGRKVSFGTLTIEDYKNWKINSMRNRENASKKEAYKAEFINLLNADKIKYKCDYINEQIHPKFMKMIIANKPKIPDPYHIWDFIIYTESCRIFVDIDGPDCDPKTGTERFYNFNRKYQSDGCPAFAILCYNNCFNEKTPVVDITGGKYNKIQLRTFIGMLNWLNDPKTQVK